LQLTSVADVAAWLPDVLLDPAAAAETDLVGEVLTWNEVVAACQDATGALWQHGSVRFSLTTCASWSDYSGGGAKRGS